MYVAVDFFHRDHLRISLTFKGLTEAAVRKSCTRWLLWLQDAFLRPDLTQPRQKRNENDVFFLQRTPARRMPKGSGSGLYVVGASPSFRAAPSLVGPCLERASMDAAGRSVGRRRAGTAPPPVGSWQGPPASAVSEMLVVAGTRRWIGLWSSLASHAFVSLPRGVDVSRNDQPHNHKPVRPTRHAVVTRSPGLLLRAELVMELPAPPKPPPRFIGTRDEATDFSSPPPSSASAPPSLIVLVAPHLVHIHRAELQRPWTGGCTHNPNPGQPLLRTCCRCSQRCGGGLAEQARPARMDRAATPQSRTSAVGRRVSAVAVTAAAAAMVAATVVDVDRH
jgi:hypothetical protein